MTEKSKKTVNWTERKSWEEFKNAGLLWWINRMLHLFGWAIAYEYSDESNKLVEVYPMRVKFRGFTEQIETENFQRLSKYVKKSAAELEKESRT